jgi:hypothetical protein
MRPGARMTATVCAPIAAPEFSKEEEDKEDGSWMGGLHLDTGAPNPEAAPGPSQIGNSEAVFRAPPPPVYVRPPPAVTDDNLAARPLERRTLDADRVPWIIPPTIPANRNGKWDK